MALNTISGNGCQLENVFSLGQTVCLKEIKLVGVTYPFDTREIQYKDQKCMLFDVASYATIPFLLSLLCKCPRRFLFPHLLG